MNGETMTSPSFTALRVSIAVCALVMMGLMCFFVSPLMVLVPVAGMMILWLILKHPVSALGSVLAFMPRD